MLEQPSGVPQAVTPRKKCRRRVALHFGAEPGNVRFGQVRQVGNEQVRAFGASRAGLMVAGYEIPHLHVHVWPSNSMSDFDMSRVDNSPEADEMDAAAETLRAGLREDGHGERVPAA